MSAPFDKSVFRVRQLTEADVDTVVQLAGGQRAHSDAHLRQQPSADYVLREAVIELKTLNDEGLAKPERQAKLASLFTRDEKIRPVVVLDPKSLRERTRNEYYRILEGPIKNAVTKARKQLRQTRLEYPRTTTSILFVINNGYTALNHDELLRLVAHRARNDSSEIDGVVVAGCYFYSDGFDNHFVWPIEYSRINTERSFPSFIKLRDAWNQCAEQFMTAVVRGELECNVGKQPVVDTQFETDGVTFVKTAPPMPFP